MVVLPLYVMVVVALALLGAELAGFAPRSLVLQVAELVLLFAMVVVAVMIPAWSTG